MTWLFFALLSAVCFGMRGILYQWSSVRGFDRSLMLFGVFSSGAIVSLAGALIWQQQWNVAILTGLAMGFFSYMANAAMFKGFSVGKASLIAIITGLPPVIVVILAYVLWRETLSAWQFAAFIIILIGIILIRYSNDLSLKNLQGAQWGLLAMLCFSFNDTAGKLSTRLAADPFPTLFCMFAMGSLCFGLNWRIEQARMKRQEQLGLRKPATSAQLQQQKAPGHTFLWGMVVGLTNAFGMILVLTAFKDGLTGLVSAVVAMNVLMILLYSRIFLREKFRPIELAGMATAISGMLILRLF